MTFRFICVVLFIINAQCDVQKEQNHVDIVNSDFIHALFSRLILSANGDIHKLHRYGFRHTDDKFLVLFDLLDFNSKIDGGIRYNLTLLFSETSCPHLQRNTDARLIPTVADCEISDNSWFSFCFQVLYRPWLKDPDIYGIEIASVRRHESPVTMPQNIEFLGVRLPKDAPLQFSGFREKFKKTYSPSEESSRYKTFKSNLLKIQLLGKLDKGSAKYGVTAFADLTESEFKKMLANAKYREPHHMSYPIHPVKYVNKGPPSSFDWRHEGAVTDVKDQGMCGSCWAFATTGNIEGQWFRKTGKLISLSEQQLLDCDAKDEACNGGLPEWAYEALVKMGGLMSEHDYPYEAHKEKVCHLQLPNATVYINGSKTLPSDEKQLAAWLAENGPISVGVNANFLQFYLGGISHPPHILCSKEGLDHAVLLVGYGVSTFLRRPYWIVKNSWGAGWGEKGYFRLYRGDGTCGINADPTTSVIL